MKYGNDIKLILKILLWRPLSINPYTFRPKVAEKYLLSTYHDLGQGLLDTIYDIYEELYLKSPNMIKKKLNLDK